MADPLAGGSLKEESVEEAESKVVFPCVLLPRSPYSGSCVGWRVRPGKAELKFIGARNFILKKTKALDREVGESRVLG